MSVALRRTRAAEPGPPAPTPLFRPEVAEERGTRWLGAVVLRPDRLHLLFAGLAIAAAAALVVLLVVGSYTRKVKVAGWLIPRQGLARVVTPAAGTVAHIHVTEGVAVKRGQPLVTISTDVQNESLVGARAEIIRLLNGRRESLTESRAIQERMLFQQQADLERRVATVETQVQYLDREIEIQAKRMRFAREIVGRQAEMRQLGLITLPRLEQSQQDAMEHAARLESLGKDRAALGNELDKARAEAREAPLRAKVQVGELDRGIGALGQELTEAESRRMIVVTAPEDGVVTSTLVDAGGSVAPNAPLMTIVPDGSILEAQLYSPSRAIGFIVPGQTVRLRYQAFPYQKFGIQEGTIVAVSRTATSPAELPPQLTALASLGGNSEPLYQISVRLPMQHIRAYGKPAPLRPNMLIDADIQVETRHLIEWIVEPLITITGR